MKNLNKSYLFLFCYFYDFVLFYIFIIICMYLIYFLFLGLFFSVSDLNQGLIFKIIYIHVSCAYLSVFLYIFVGLLSYFYIKYKIIFFNDISYYSAIIGFYFTLFVLYSGSVWAKPMWGVWWIWDARLTSEIVLLFLYLGYLILNNLAKKSLINYSIVPIFNIIGVIDIPIIHYSVEWWYTLHQKSTFISFKSDVDLNIIFLLLFCLFILFFIYVFFLLFFFKNKYLIKYLYD